MGRPVNPLEAIALVLLMVGSLGTVLVAYYLLPNLIYRKKRHGQN